MIMRFTAPMPTAKDTMLEQSRLAGLGSIARRCWSLSKDAHLHTQHVAIRAGTHS